MEEEKKTVKKSMSPGVVIVCVICGCIMFLGFWFIVIGQLFSHLFGGFSTNSNREYNSKELYGNTIDVIRVEGTIQEGQGSYRHQWTLATINALMEDDKNKGILLYVDSPGGGIYESDELYLKLKEYKEKTERPVYAYMAQQAASGGLYICMAADKIYANRMTMTGSIGVIMSLTDTTGLQKLIGVKQDNIVSGKNKAMGNPLTDSQRDILQQMVDESYQTFVDIIVENRGLTEEKVREIGDGRIYSSKQAQELGIIDEIATYEEAVRFIQANLEDCEIYEQMPPPATIWDQILYGVQSTIGTIKGASELDKINNYIEESKLPQLMYYRY